MGAYDDRPWLSQYPANRRGLTDTDDAVTTILDAFARLTVQGDKPLLHYFDATLTAAEIDVQSDAFAVALQDAGFQPGERAVVYLQNIPQFVIAQLAVWKAGGIVVSANPMYRGKELGEILSDSGAAVLITLRSLYRDVASTIPETGAVRTIVTTSELEYQSRSDATLAGVEAPPCLDTSDMLELISAHRGQVPPRPGIVPGDVAVLTYTSGTTGPPKGAMTTHANLLFSARVYRDWIGIGPDDVILGVAPMFHVTGIVGHSALALLTGAPLILTYRFDAQDTVEAIAAHGATFTVGSITVFIALMNAPNASGEALASLNKIYSGGAPIPPATLAAFEERFGSTIHNIYGLTETTSPAIAVPLGSRAPHDEASGTSAVGVPVFDTVVRVIDDDGAELPAGEPGELLIEGPQVVVGYWDKPEATAEALTPRGLRTGDIGFMNADGWFFLVDRKKDQINASGFKVWPREVEDVLYELPAVREAAVVGVPDAYRGETVKAFVSFRPGQSATREEIVAHAKARLATYKVPREVEILDDIPKTATGKLLRRQLRDLSATAITTKGSETP